MMEEQPIIFCLVLLNDFKAYGKDKNQGQRASGI